MFYDLSTALPITHRAEKLKGWRVNLRHFSLRETLTNGSLPEECHQWKKDLERVPYGESNRWCWGCLVQDRQSPRLQNCHGEEAAHLWHGCLGRGEATSSVSTQHWASIWKAAGEEWLPHLVQLLGIQQETESAGEWMWWEAQKQTSLPIMVLLVISNRNQCGCSW